MKKRDIFLKAAAWLWILTAATTALWSNYTAAKYCAAGTVTASARVAKFNPVWACTSGAAERLTGYILHPAIGNVTANWTTAYSVTWRCTNDSEVAVNAATTAWHRPIAQDAANGIGWYVTDGHIPSPHVKSPDALSTACLTSYVPFGGTAARVPKVTSVTPASAVIAPSAFQDFTYTFQGYTTAPSVNYPNSLASVNTFNGGRTGLLGADGSDTGSFTAPTPFTYTILCHDTNNPNGHNITSMRDTLWRSYRVNSTGSVTQID